jgi:hypothetical protein
MPVTINGTTGITSPGGDTSTSLTTSGLTIGTTPIGAGNASRFKNRIINGDMRIDQRNAGASVTPSSAAYTIDRWQYYGSQASKFTIQQNAGSVTPPIGFSNYLGATVASAVTVGASDFFAIDQNIEGFNFADLGWGTANAKTVTLSFWVRSSLTGTFGGTLLNGANNRSYPFSYTITAANTWELETITITGDTSGTWIGATNGNAVTLLFGLGVGSTRLGTANAWASGSYWSPTGSVSVVGTAGATFYITGVQLEVGSIATGFEYVDYGTQLAMCQRYFVKTNPDNASRSGGSWGSYYNTNGSALTGNLPVTMRAAPTFARGGTNDTFYVSGINAASSGTSLLFSATTSWYSFEANAMVTATLGNPVIYNGQASLSAEL